jgi:hypothetical protein
MEYPWNRNPTKPYNFYNKQILEAIIEYLLPNYQIVYNRMVHSTEEAKIKSLGEKEMIRSKYKDVIILEDLLEKHNISKNLLQLKIFSNCDNFISVQGGNSILASYFSKHNIIYAITGRELEHNDFQNWYHKLGGSKIYDKSSYDDVFTEIKNIY